MERGKQVTNKDYIQDKNDKNNITIENIEPSMIEKQLQSENNPTAVCISALNVG